MRAASVLVVLVILGGCGSETPRSGAAPGTADTAARVEPAPDSAAVPAPAASSMDSTQLVQQGGDLFRSMGCVRCHTVGAGYRDGPDLAGVTRRRTYDWIAALLTNTEEMIQTDPDLQQLRMEHFLDMPGFRATPGEVRALYYYIRATSPPGQP